MTTSFPFSSRASKSRRSFVSENPANSFWIISRFSPSIVGLSAIHSCKSYLSVKLSSEKDFFSRGIAFLFCVLIKNIFCTPLFVITVSESGNLVNVSFASSRASYVLICDLTMFNNIYCPLTRTFYKTGLVALNYIIHYTKRYYHILLIAINCFFQQILPAPLTQESCSLIKEYKICGFNSFPL